MPLPPFCGWALPPAEPRRRPDFMALMMRPVLRGREYAISSMKPQATQAAERVLLAGGNAFDACVAGQAVLSVVDAEMNGIGGDAVILIYDARARRISGLR